MVQKSRPGRGPNNLDVLDGSGAVGTRAIGVSRESAGAVIPAFSADSLVAPTALGDVPGGWPFE